MNSAKWCFPSNNGGEKRGFNDSGIEIFKDNPIKSLAREICQNSLDAVIGDKTAIVEFSSFDIKSCEFPDKDGFANILNKCLDYSKNNKNPKTHNFFKNAIEVINSQTIRMLRISDFNTTGLKGIDWDNLVNSSGASEKSENKGGSFGIGKNAPFACSNFRTVFYSTLDLDGKQRSKGVSRLISYKLGENADHTDNLSQGTGYFGIDNTYSIKHLEQMLNLDKDFNRETSGTDIFVSAFKMSSEEDFMSNIIAEVLDGFLVAIWQNKLEIKVNNYVINKDSLETVVATYQKSLNDNTIMCYQLLSDEKTEWHKLPVKLSGTMYLGDINFGFKLRYDGTNKVSMFRSSGMKIIDKSNLCPSLRFIGLAMIEGDALNNFLRSLENPSHNKWEPQRSDNPTMARSLLRDIYNDLTNKLNEVAANTFDDEIDIDGAGEYLPDEIEENSKNEKSINKEESLNKIINIEVKVIEKPKTVANLETDEIGDDIQTSVDSEGNQIEGTEFDGFEHLGNKSKGFGERDFEDIGVQPNDGMKGQEIITVKSKEMRIFCINKREHLYRLIFSPTISSIKGYLEIFKLAEQNDKMPIEIIGVKDNQYEYWKNKVGYFKFVENEFCNVDIKIADDEYATMEVKLYAYKG